MKRHLSEKYLSVSVLHMLQYSMSMSKSKSSPMSKRHLSEKYPSVSVLQTPPIALHDSVSTAPLQLQTMQLELFRPIETVVLRCVMYEMEKVPVCRDEGGIG